MKITEEDIKKYMKTTEENIKRYKSYLRQRGYDKLSPMKNLPEDDNEVMKILATEGMKILEKEAGTHTPAKTLDAALGATDPNPYVRARIQVLKDLSDKRRLAIEEMEKSGKTDNPEYIKFASAVTLLGDKLSDEKS